MSMKIIAPLAALILAANVWAIAPAMDKEYDNKQATIINHKFDNLDDQADIDGENLASNEWEPVSESGYTDEYLQSEQYQTIKAANESLRRIKQQ